MTRKNCLIALLAFVSLGITVCVTFCYLQAEGPSEEVVTQLLRMQFRMNEVKSAAVQYANKHNGVYPTRLESFAETSKFQNPYTREEELPVMGTFKHLEEIRTSTPLSIGAGIVQYNLLAGGRGIAIIGGGKDGLALTELDHLIMTWGDRDVIGEERGGFHAFMWSSVSREEKAKMRTQLYVVSSP